MGRKAKDDLIDVHCRKCGEYLATTLPNASVLCQKCSPRGEKEIWTIAKQPN